MRRCRGACQTAESRQVLVEGSLRRVNTRFLNFSGSQAANRVGIDHEDDGRILASVPDLPGVMAYGITEIEAVRKVKTIALQVLADMDSEEVGPAALSKIGKETGLRPEDL